MQRGNLAKLRLYLGRSRRRLPGHSVDVQHHVLGRRHDRVVVVLHNGEDVQPFGVVRQELNRDAEVIAGVALGDEVEVALDGVVRAARL